jgi:predicted dehydrogenase
MDEIRIGLIGVGVMGRTHFNNIRSLEGIRVTALADIDPGRMDFFDGPRFTDGNELISSGLCDAVLIATPHYFHTPFVIEALGKGLHVLTEKPLAVHVNDGKRMIAAHKDKSRVFGIMFQQRTDPIYIKARELVNDGSLGELRRVNWIITDWFRPYVYYSSGGWRATWKGEGGGVLLNQCPHNLDLLQWITGLPARITARVVISHFHDIEVEDEVTAILDYPNGAAGVFITSTWEAPGTNRLELVGEKGKFVVEDRVLTFTRNMMPMTEFSRTTPESFSKPGTSIERYEFKNDFGLQHTGVVRAFRDTIRGRGPLIASAEEGLRSLEMGNAMLFSGLTGKPVDLPIDGDAYEAKLNELIAGSKYINLVRQFQNSLSTL